ncbi:hypothetical protein SDC9_211770 [bioreactor metagenome]|uniref:Uncharacterized protein n=1 Tax=bioreactor metagenome TaxID=1076179 RepID=A0A645JK86_9ZZZZ
MFCHDNFSDTHQRITPFIFGIPVIFGTVNKTDNIRVLLNSTRFAQIGQLRPFTFNTLPVFYSTVQLRQGDNGNIQFFG